MLTFFLAACLRGRNLGRSGPVEPLGDSDPPLAVVPSKFMVNVALVNECDTIPPHLIDRDPRLPRQPRGREALPAVARTLVGDCDDSRTETGKVMLVGSASHRAPALGAIAEYNDAALCYTYRPRAERSMLWPPTIVGSLRRS